MRRHPLGWCGAPGRVLVIGGGGRVATLLRRAWALDGGPAALWQSRGSRAGDAQFDPLSDPAAFREAASGADAILCLAGATTGGPEVLAAHAGLAVAACRAAHAAGVPRVLLASSAAVYGPTAQPAREAQRLRPVSAYGLAKREMERRAAAWRLAAGSGAPAVTCLRIGNVAGADSLLGEPGPERPHRLDIFADGTAPRRSYVGPRALARILAGLVAAGASGRQLPFALNVAQAGAVSMAALLAADRRSWAPRPAPAGAIASFELDISRLARLVPVPDGGDAAAIVADLRSLDEEARDAA